jgi:hypothetical protein
VATDRTVTDGSSSHLAFAPILNAGQKRLGCYVDTSRKRSECFEYEALRSVVLSKEVYFK